MQGSIIVNGEHLTARETLTRKPQLRGFLQPGARLKESTLHAKLRRLFKKGKIPDYIFDESPPEFFKISNALSNTFVEYKLEDPRIYNHDIVSIFDYLKPRILDLIKAHPDTKIYLNIHATMVQQSSGDRQVMGLRTGAQEFLKDTDPEKILNTLREIIYERLAKLEKAVGH